MANIYEIHARCRVSLRKLREMDKLGYLKISHSEADDMKGRIHATLAKGNKLTAEMLLALYKHPTWVDALDKYPAAEDAREALGDVAREACPWELAAEIPAAATRDAGAIDKLAKWLAQHIDGKPAYAGSGQGYHYVAVRMLHDIPPDLLSQNVPALAKALVHVRKHPAMLGRSTTDETTKRSSFHHVAANTGHDL